MFSNSVRPWLPVVLVLTAVLAGAKDARGQQSAASASVAGSVRDSSNAVVDGAVVTLQHRATNQVLTAVTDGRGQYRFIYVPVGDYRLSVAVDGFAPVAIDMTLAIGQAVEVPVTLVVAARDETVTVTGQAPIVDAARTQIADAVTPRDIDTLPLNGRNYLDLALLVPNVSRHNTRSNERFAETSAVPGSGISVAGQRNLGNSFVVDGLSANDDAADLAGTYYGEEVIREFQIVTAGGMAEFGRAAAGTINIVTQAGSNEPRGRAYGFFRHDALDARNALATTKDPLRQSQYGLSFGGPIRRDRSFWFANVEQTRQDKTGFVTIDAANQPSNTSAVNAALDAVGYRGPRVASGPFSTGYDTSNVFVRIDDRTIGDSRLELRYSFYNVASPNARGVGGLNDLSRGTRLDNTDHTAAASLISLLSPRVINETRAQYSRSRLDAPVNDTVGPAVTVSGIAAFGTSTSSPTGRDLDVVQLAETVTMQQGAHLFKAGADVLYNRVSVAFPGALQGSYAFSSLANLQKGVYQTYQQAFGIASLAQSNPNTGAFVQDEWRPRTDLTVNAGLRYDLQWLPAPIALDRNNLSPRAGVAWAPGAGRLVVRASGGVYYDRIPLRATSNALQRDGLKYKVAVLSFGQDQAPSFPAVLPAFPSGLVTAVTTMDPEIQNGRSEQFGLQVERALGKSISATAGYTYLRGHQIIMSRNINVPTLTAAQAAAQGVENLGRPNPEFSNISQYQSIGDSWFHGLTLSMTTRSMPWGSARLSYTLSTATDDAGNAFFSSPQNNADILADKGPSDNDQRHRLVVSGAIGGPGSAFSRGLAGFEVGYVLSYASGVPFNPQAGSDLNNDTNLNDRPAGVGRNSARQPATGTLDLRLSRGFDIGRMRIEALIEAFNLLNRTNVLAVNSNFGTGQTPAARFGEPTLAGDPRQVQLGVRWNF